MLESINSLKQSTQEELDAQAEESRNRLAQLSQKETERLDGLCRLSFIGQLIGFSTVNNLLIGHLSIKLQE